MTFLYDNMHVVLQSWNTETDISSIKDTVTLSGFIHWKKVKYPAVYKKVIMVCTSKLLGLKLLGKISEKSQVSVMH